MSRVLAIKLQSQSAMALVVRPDGGRIVIEGAATIPLGEGDDAKARGQTIAAGIAELRSGRMHTVLVVPRSELSWQNHDLPPVPVDDLPDLVHLQAQRDLAISDDGEGFDFLPLSGDEEHPYKVIGVGLLPAPWKLLRETCDAADLKVDRIVPEPLGWPELGRLVTSDSPGALTVFSAIVERQATVWATEGESLRLMRTVWLPEDDNAVADAAALGGELRRTLLALAQSHGEHRGAVKCVYIGANADEIAGELGATLSKPVQAVPLERLVDMSAVGSTANVLDAAPTAGLAAAAAEHRRAPLDLLHPRKRPAPPTRRRTYVLAGAALAALVAFMAWRGYRNIQEPLEAAAEADASRVALAPILEAYAKDETKAAAIQGWLDTSVNLLTELDHLAPQLRPEPLASEKFKADQDVVLKKLVVANRELTLETAVKNNDSIPPLETRLRAAGYQADRGAVDPKAEGVPGYGIGVTGTIQRVDPADAAEGGVQ
jgi:HAMP domain-containing protein